MGKLVAIGGGIGSGKSIVSGILRTMGFRVYDCDSNAKDIMTSDEVVKREIIAEFGNEVYRNNELNRAGLARIVFNDEAARERLNAIVHPRVISHVLQWWKNGTANGEVVAFVETALLKESGFDAIVDDVWWVEAPEKIKIERVRMRDGMNEEDIKARIKAQDNAPDEHWTLIDNSENVALLPQVMRLLSLYENQK